MTQFNPITGSILQTPVAQQQQSVDKARQLRRAQDLEKNVAARDDEMEHQVENTEETEPVDDEQQNPSKGRPQDRKSRQSKKKGDDDKPHIDMTA